MSMLSKSWGTDKSKEQDGVWVDIGINDDESKSVARIKIRRAGQSNKKFKTKFASLGKKFRMMRGDKTELENNAFREAFCQTCIVGWENIENLNVEAPTDQPKQPYMPFTVDNALMLFTAFPDLFDFVTVQATELDTFRTEMDTELGNS